MESMCVKAMINITLEYSYDLHTRMDFVTGEEKLYLMACDDLNFSGTGVEKSRIVCRF